MVQALTGLLGLLGVGGSKIFCHRVGNRPHHWDEMRARPEGTMGQQQGLGWGWLKGGPIL